MDYKAILGLLAVVIGIAGYVPYIRDCIRKRTKPSPYTWSIWAIITFLIFLTQFLSGAGPAAWVILVTWLIEIIVVFFALRNKHSELSIMDTTCFVLAILAILLWKVTSSALYAIILLTIADALGFIITFRKTYKRPYDETLTTYSFAALKYVLAFFAITAYSLTTMIYPVYLILFNTVFVAMALIRRKAVKKRV